MSKQEYKDAKTIKLKPCPFCGGKAKIWETYGGSAVQCGLCGATTLIDGNSIVIEKWNRRIADKTKDPQERVKS